NDGLRVSVFSDGFLLRWGLDSRFCGNDGLGVSVFSDGFLLRWGLDSRFRGNDAVGVSVFSACLFCGFDCRYFFA
ncbi:TPA: hypothetical protein ACFOXX_001876, partial [Neisseria meningitidis]